jgi:hypothetical protein
MEAVAARTPILALPIAFDHPGGAARSRHHRGCTAPANGGGQPWMSAATVAATASTTT